MTRIDMLFDQMDKWRHFPSYQLERRADIFFSLYLVEVLEAKLGFPMHPEIVPEFPVRIGTIYPDKSTNKSYKVDYVATSAARDKAILVELKTDTQSRRREQDKYLLAAEAAGLHKLLEGLLDIFRATTSKRKYFCLLQHLEQMGLLVIPKSMSDIMTRPTLRGIDETSRGVEIKVAPTETLVVYVQPEGNGPNIITFRDFAEVARKHDDEVSKRFAQSALEWAEVSPGKCP